MTKSYLMMAACTLLLPASLVLADVAPSPRPVNALGRGTLCLAGTVETAKGCVPQQAQAAAGLKSEHIRDCLANRSAKPAESSLSGSRARYLYCLYRFNQEMAAATN